MENRKSKLGLFFLSFSPVWNFKKLFTVDNQGDDNLLVLNGIRTLSICWVVLGHAYLYLPNGLISNVSTFANAYNPILFAVGPGGVYAVDVFFFLSGFLTFYLLTAKLYPKGGWDGCKNFLLLYFHRFYRLIFPVVFVTGITVWLMKYFGNGPFYRTEWETAFVNNCRKYWWTNFLFINNFVPWDLAHSCLGYMWYLANDFQFYLITPPIIVAYCNKRRASYIAVFAIISVCVLYNGVMSAVFNIGPIYTPGDKISQGNFLYDKPWARCGPYFVGGLLGWSYFERKFKDKHPALKYTTFNRIYSVLSLSKVMCYVLAIIGVGLMPVFILPLRNWTMYCTESNCWSRFATVIFTAIYRTGFVTCLALIILPVLCNRFTFIKYFLSANILTV